jgi:hemoglobin
MRALLALVLAGACWTGPAPPPPATRPEPAAPARPPLYERLGGSRTIRVLTDVLVDNLGEDARLNLHFMNTDVQELRSHLAEWLCAATDGPCSYTGKRVRAAHAGMGITGDDFEAFVDVFTRSLNRIGVTGREKVELLLLVRRARSHVVER